MPIGPEALKKIVFIVGVSKDGKSKEVPPNAVYHDASGDYPAMIVRERKNEFTAHLGDDKFEPQSRPSADLRVCFGNLTLKRNVNGQLTEVPEDVPVNGVALKGCNINVFSKSWYEPLKVAEPEAEAKVSVEKSQDQARIRR